MNEKEFEMLLKNTRSLNSTSVHSFSEKKMMHNLRSKLLSFGNDASSAFSQNETIIVPTALLFCDGQDRSERFG